MPLAEALLTNPTLDPMIEAAKYLNPELEFSEAKTVLEGARQIIMENMAEDAATVGDLREYLWEQGVLSSKVVVGKELEGAKFADYFAYQELLHKIPSHRYLALLRGRNEGILDLTLDIPVPEGQTHPSEVKLAKAFGIQDTKVVMRINGYWIPCG